MSRVPTVFNMVGQDFYSRYLRSCFNFSTASIYVLGLDLLPVQNRLGSSGGFRGNFKLASARCVHWVSHLVQNLASLLGSNKHARFLQKFACLHGVNDSDFVVQGVYKFQFVENRIYTVTA